MKWASLQKRGEESSNDSSIISYFNSSRVSVVGSYHQSGTRLSSDDCKSALHGAGLLWPPYELRSKLWHPWMGLGSSVDPLRDCRCSESVRVIGYLIFLQGSFLHFLNH